MKIINIILLLILSCLYSCQDDDTYTDLIKEAQTRYVGKCKNVSVQKGWNRVKINWENSVDPTISKIFISWKSDSSKDSCFVSKDQTSFITPNNLEDKNYEVKICSMDSLGRKSLESSFYLKPFTKNDETINVLKIIEDKYFFIDNNLIIFLSKSDKLINEAKVKYTRNSQDQEYIITTEDFNTGYLVIEDINMDNKVTIESVMKLQECFDEIVFDPYELDKNTISMRGDFIKNLKVTFDKLKIEDEFLASVETLYFDCDITSLEDIMYLPNLKKIVIGNKTYLDAAYANPNSSFIHKLSDKEKSIFAINKMREYRDIEVEIYGDHYKISSLLGIEKKPYPSVPTINFFSEDEMSNWKVNYNYPLADISGDNFILDNDPSTIWKPQEIINDLRKHEIIIDMKSIKDLHGIFISQVDNNRYQKYIPSSIELHLSENNSDWYTPFVSMNVELKYSPNCKNVLEFSGIKKARYVKIILSDKVYTSNNYVVLGDFIPY